MNIKTIFSGLIFVGMVWGVFIGIKQLKENSQDDLVTVGKAPLFSFVNQNAEVVTNNTFQGKIYVVDFFFTTCPSICPLMTQNMKLIQDEFITDNSVALVSFSINPEYDTVEILKEYAKRNGVTSTNWHFLTGGSQQQVFELSNKGFNIYAGVGEFQEGGFEHSGLFALIDSNGNIVCRKNEKGNPIIYYNGLDVKQVQMLIQDIKKLQKKK